MRRLLLGSILVSALSVAPLWPASAQELPNNATVIMSEPGKALAASTVEMSAKVVAIDPDNRVVSLKGPKGKVVDVIASDEVRNFDQIRLGDTVRARYTESLYLELKKTKGAKQGPVERAEITRAQPGERPGGTAAHEVVALADVVDVNPAKKTISLKGPKGDVVTLPVHNPDQFKVVKKGDQVEVTYTQALAISVEPEAPAKK